MENDDTLSDGLVFMFKLVIGYDDLLNVISCAKVKESRSSIIIFARN